MEFTTFTTLTNTPEAESNLISSESLCKWSEAKVWWRQTRLPMIQHLGLPNTDVSDPHMSLIWLKLHQYLETYTDNCDSWRTHFVCLIKLVIKYRNISSLSPENHFGTWTNAFMRRQTISKTSKWVRGWAGGQLLINPVSIIHFFCISFDHHYHKMSTTLKG